MRRGTVGCARRGGRAIAAAVLFGLLWGVGTWRSPVAAQESADVRGVVVDSAGKGVDGAMVVALALPDSILTRFSLTGRDGTFTLKRVPHGAFVLQVTRVGYRPTRTPVDVVGKLVDAGPIEMRVQAVEMEELVVSVDHVPFVTRRDTLDYNALAFEVRPNATVEELLARLPGIEVDSDGTIRAQGEEVRNVLVDGKEFFGSDPTIATRNLPADAVERVKVYDKQSDMAEFTGIPDGEEERTINLELRENARRGVFGRLAGGLGGALEPAGALERHPDGRTRYNESVTLARFSPSTQLALLGGANNVNEAGFAWGDFVSFRGGAQSFNRGGGGRRGGIQLGGGRSDGFTRTRALGLNLSRDFERDRWLRTSYFYTSLANTLAQSTLQQQLLGSAVAGLESASANQVTDNGTHRFNVNGQYSFSEGHDVRLRGNLSFGSSTSSSTSSSRTTALDGVLLNNGTSRNVVEGSDATATGRLTWRKRISETGRALVAEAWLTQREPDLQGDLETTTSVTGRDGALRTTRVLQDQSRTGRTRSLSQRLSLTQPLGEVSVLEIFGQHSAVDEDQTNTVFDLGQGEPVLNERLSSGFNRTYSYARGGLRLGRTTESQRLALGLQVQRSNLEGTIRDRSERIQNGFTHVLPTLDARIQLGDARTLTLRYATSTREPSMTELQPFEDNTNPLRIYVGNPDLVPEYRHTVNAEYRFFDEFSFVNLFSYVRATYTHNGIVQSRTIDERALQHVHPVNVDHTWSVASGLTYGRPIRPLGADLDLSYAVDYSRNIELLNREENRGRVWRNTVGASIDNRDKDVWDLRAGARFAFNNVAYTLNSELNQSYLDRTFFGSGRLRFGHGWTVAASLDYRLYDDDVFGPAARDVALLGASVSRLAMDDRVEVELTGFDLLNQNRGVAYTNGPSYIQERRSESLGRYLMLRVHYRLGALGGRGPGPGFGRRPRGPDHP